MRGKPPSPCLTSVWPAPILRLDFSVSPITLFAMYSARILSLLLVPVLVSSCKLGPDYERPAVAVPESFPGVAGGESIGDRSWNEVFTDPVLRGLIDEALRNNQDLVQATYRIEEARALAGVARSEFFPVLGGDASISRRRNSNDRTPPGVNPYSTEYSLGAMMSYEVDLWGRVRRSNEAARANLLGSTHARAAVETGLIAAVAAAYIDLRTFDRQLQIAQQTLKSRRESLDLVNERAAQGVSSDLEVGQAEVLFYQAQVAIPIAETSIATTEHALSVLLGRLPGRVARGLELEQLGTRVAVKGGIPSALLERRPDLMATEQRLVALNANIGVAKAAWFPALSLTASGGFASTDLDRLLTSNAGAWSFAPSLTAPLFTGGRITSQVRATEARRDEAVAAYQGAIQQAFREVADALETHRKSREIVGSQEKLVESFEKVARLATERYDAGASSYLEVLDAERNVFDGRLALAEARRGQLLSIVAAYRALGGGWTK